MENPKHLFTGDISWISSVDINAPIDGAGVHRADDYDDLFLSAAKAAQEAGELEKEVVYRFLGQLCSIHLSMRDITAPYGPQMSGLDGRTCQPSDLSAEDLEAIQQICLLSKHDALKSRLYDFRFLQCKDYRAVPMAIDCFIATARDLVGSGRTWDVTSHLKRALQLGKISGKRSEHAKRAVDAAVDIVRNAAKTPNDALLCWGVKLLNEFGLGDPKEFLPSMNIAAEELVHKGDEHRARSYYETMLELYRRLNDKDGEATTYRSIGNTFVREAEKRATRGHSSNMAAASILKDGIEALRQGGEEDDRVRELKARLLEYQSKAGDELGSFSSSVDISGSVTAAMNHVKGRSLHESILRLAFGQPETDLKTVQERVLGNAKDAPLLHLLDTTVLDGKGRTRTVRRGLLNLEGEEYDKVLRQHMIAQVSQFDWSMRAQAFINPAREQITSEHHPTADDLIPVVLHNPFIPRGHEGIIAKGLLAGFYGDFLTASHLLVPQFENSIRYMLETAGVDITNLMSDKTERLKLLGALLGKEETEKFLGPGICFELAGILAEESGYNFRHRVTHGMVTEAECYGPAGLNAWWLMLRLCVNLVIPRLTDGGREVDIDQSEVQ
jgi:hypothetical protein